MRRLFVGRKQQERGIELYKINFTDKKIKRLTRLCKLFIIIKKGGALWQKEKHKENPYQGEQVAAHSSVVQKLGVLIVLYQREEVIDYDLCS